MATINIYDLKPAGYELLNDSESFLYSLSESELDNTNGALSPVIIYTVAVNSWWFVGAGAASLASGVFVSITNRK